MECLGRKNADGKLYYKLNAYVIHLRLWMVPWDVGAIRVKTQFLYLRANITAVKVTGH